MNGEGLLSRESVLVKLRAAQWALVSRFQERVMPLIYSLGEELDVRTIDLKLGVERVIVSSKYCNRGTIFDLEVVSMPHLIGYVEMDVADLPEQIPSSFFESLPDLDECQGMHLTLTDDYGIWLRMPITQVQTSDDLRLVMRSMEQRCEMIEAALSELSNDEEAMAKIEGALRADASTVRIIN